MLCGIAWGSLLDELSGAVPAELVNNGFWVSMFVALSIVTVFRFQLLIQLVWIATVFFPLVFFLVLEKVESGSDYLQIIMVFLAVMAVSAMLLSRKQTGQTDLIDHEDTPELKKQYEDLRVAFAAQDSAIRAETALRQAVEESLRQANRVAEAANHSKTEFMAMIGHEIRTPLNGILPILEILNETRLDQDQAQLVNTAAYSSRQLLRIINDVLDFSKAEVGKLEIESIELDLHELVYSITGLMKQAADSKGLMLKVHIADDVPEFIRSDSLRLKQILTNLLSNALKFTEQGEISVEVTLNNESVREVEIMFTVSDTGIGMTSQTAGKLFRSFTQADASTTRTYGGTGLGLAICKRLVELMDGDIGVQSDKDKGSKFWFSLPMRKSLKMVPALREHARDTRILFYSRERDRISEELRQVQHDCKVQLEISHDFDDAAEKISNATQPGERNFYDLVVIDVFGHEISVTQDLENLKRYLHNSFTQILVINALPNQVQECRAAGADAVLERPFKTEIFKQRIFRLLDIDLVNTLDAVPEEGSILNDMLSADEFNGKTLLDNVSGDTHKKAFSGKVLLVEDNPTNMAVARRMLQLQGLEVFVARDGNRAIEAMRDQAFDLVFMDCLMPGMDGYEATQMWREHEKAQGSRQHQIIVAMTANAMRGDREKCIAARMDDYLPKPLNMSSLKDTLARWLSENPQETDVIQEEPAEEMVIPEDLLDREVLSELRQVMGSDYRSVIYTYLQHATQLLTDMKHKADEGDLLSVLKAAHSFKSSSKNVGAVKLGEKARVLEENLRSEKPVNVKQVVQEIVVAYDEVAKAFQDLVR